MKELKISAFSLLSLFLCCFLFVEAQGIIQNTTPQNDSILGGDSTTVSDSIVGNDSIIVNDSIPVSDSIPSTDSIPVVDSIPSTDSIPEIDTTVVVEPVKNIIRVNLENEVVRRFMEEVEYTRESESQIINYVNSLAPSQRGDIPNPLVMDIPVYNPDTLITLHLDTILNERRDTVINQHTDTLYYVPTESVDKGYADTLITSTVDTVITITHTTSYIISRDTIVNIPNDTLLFCYSLQEDSIRKADTIVILNGTTELEVYNLIPQHIYDYSIVVNDSVLTEGEIHTEGKVRMIYAPSILNIRDLGGWTTDNNKRIKYGKIYRGGELNGVHTADSIDVQRLLDLGIRAELDLRAWYNEGIEVSVFGFNSDSTYLYTNDSGQLPEHMTSYRFLNNWKKEFNFIVSNLRKNNPVYQHCVWGRDRTGYLSILLQGLLGVSYSDLMKDYELTYLTYRSANDKKAEIDAVISYLNSLEGETLKEKINTFFVKKVGVSQDIIDYFRSEMLEDINAVSTEDKDDDIITNVQEKYIHHPISDSHEIYDLKGNRILNNNDNSIIISKGKDGLYRKLFSK